MPLVNVILNDRSYTVSCDEGEQDHVRDLGQFLDKRVRELTASVGQVGDARLLLMAALTIADELSEALTKISERDKEIAALTAPMIDRIASCNSCDLRPRWEGHPWYWERLLLAAQASDDDMLRGIHLYSLQLLGGELIQHSS